MCYSQRSCYKARLQFAALQVQVQVTVEFEMELRETQDNDRVLIKLLKELRFNL